MICVSILEESVQKTLDALENVDSAEIRLDNLNPTREEMDLLFARKSTLIATMRPTKYDDEIRADVLTRALDAGAAFVDVEIESEAEFKKEVISAAKSKGKKVIVSHHDFEKTPSTQDLQKIVSACFEAGADIAKVACQVQTPRDNAVLMGLVDNDRPVVAIGMGPLGRITRLASLPLGSPLTFASKEQGKEAAPGQLDIKSLDDILKMLE